MGALWHQSAYPTILGGRCEFSFIDVAEIHIQAPHAYEQARRSIQKWEMQMGAVWFRHNANLAQKFYMAKREWWVTFV